MEQLPLTFVQSTLDADIKECFDPAFNFNKLSSSNGRLAFTTGKVYWLPDAPIALLDQGWVINISEIESCAKYGLAGFGIKLKDGKELRFSNVGGKMREGITAAIEAHKGDVAPAEAEAAPAPAQEAAAAEAASPNPVISETAAAGEAPVAEAAGFDPADVSNGKLMAVLAYLGVFVLIPLFAAKESKFARFHTNQGLILLICFVVSYFISLISWLSFLSVILNVVLCVFAIIGIVNVIKGEAKPLPFIGKYRIIE